MTRGRIEIEDELSNLRELINAVPQTTAFGDDNQDAIQAQIEVISRRMTLKEIADEYENEGDYIMSAALSARSWLQDDDEPVSEGWRELAEDQAPCIERVVA